MIQNDGKYTLFFLYYLPWHIMADGKSLKGCFRHPPLLCFPLRKNGPRIFLLGKKNQPTPMHTSRVACANLKEHTKAFLFLEFEI